MHTFWLSHSRGDNYFDKLTWIFLAHLKLAHEVRKDTKEGLSVGGFAVFSKVRGSFAEFFHSSLLQGLQRLDCWMTVFQEVLQELESRDTKVLSPLVLHQFQPTSQRSVRLFGSFVKDTLMTTAKRSSAVAGIFWQAERMSWMVVCRSFRSDVIVLWFTIDRCVCEAGKYKENESTLKISDKHEETQQ